MILYDAQRHPVELGQAVGHGGEATVYRVINAQNLLAKIYEPEPRLNYAGKLDWMVNHPPENPTQKLEHPSLAWPGGLLFDSRRRLKGYWMPHIQHAVPMLEVFNPRRRAEVLPEFDRRYLLRTARNLAAALSALHRSGYVAGDINESNVLVTPTALVTLIDTDSFQVREERDGNQIIHPCPVGKPEYTPPELQRRSLADVIRQPDHDAFGLAVLIFQLLMEGSHPFRAQWLAAGDPPPLEVRIANGAYPYMEHPAYPILPPKNGLSINTLHPWLVELFQRCFVEGHRDPRWRPGPDLWVRALNEAEQAQILCAEGHYYSSHLRECPYCALIQKRSKAQPTRPADRTRHEPIRGRVTWTAPARNQGGRWGMPQPAATQQAAPAATARAAARPARNAVPFGAGAPASAVVPTGAGAPAGTTVSAGRVGGISSIWGGTGAFVSKLAGWPGTAAPVSTAAPVGSTPGWGGLPANGRASVFSFPASSSKGVLRSRPVISPMAVRYWARQQALNSLKVGGLQGALAGALPGAVIGLVNWSGGSLLDWGLLFSLGGAAGGLLRGWKPGHKIASVIDRYVGWKLFWQIIGFLIGITIGGALGLMFIWAVIPIFLGLILGAQGGLYLGKKVWQLGSGLGWERIWGAVSAFGFGGLGFGLAKLLGLVGADIIGGNLATGLQPFAANGSLWWAAIWVMAGATGGALSGALAGILADVIGRFSGLVD